MELQFTRYLYEKEEVKMALLVAILNKKEEAIFWTYELYYSGFIEELIEFLWKIYYDFYATLNPSFEKYLINKFNCKLKNDEKIICSIVNNFMIRPHTMDVFMLRNIIHKIDIDKGYILEYTLSGNLTCLKKELIDLLENEDYIMLASFIIQDIQDKHLLNTCAVIDEYFVGKRVKNIDLKNSIQHFKKIMRRNTLLNARVILLSRIIHYYSAVKNRSMGKNLYVHIDDEEVVMYETIISEKLCPAYKILPVATIYYIDNGDYLSLFHLSRDNCNIVDAYKNNWLFYASFSPVWKDRIQKYNGMIDIPKKEIIFNSDNDLEDFYENFGLEPDEQKTEVQNKTIQIIQKKRSWLEFYKEHNKNGIVDIEEEYIRDIEKIKY